MVQRSFVSFIHGENVQLGTRAVPLSQIRSAEAVAWNVPVLRMIQRAVGGLFLIGLGFAIHWSLLVFGVAALFVAVVLPIYRGASEYRVQFCLSNGEMLEYRTQSKDHALRLAAEVTDRLAAAA